MDRDTGAAAPFPLDESSIGIVPQVVQEIFKTIWGLKRKACRSCWPSRAPIWRSGRGELVSAESSEAPTNRVNAAATLADAPIAVFFAL